MGHVDSPSNSFHDTIGPEGFRVSAKSQQLAANPSTSKVAGVTVFSPCPQELQHPEINELADQTLHRDIPTPPPLPKMRASPKLPPSPKRLPSLQRRIHEQMDRMSLGKAREQIESAVNRARADNADSVYEMPTLGSSLNEVTKFETPVFIEGEKIRQAQPQIRLSLVEVKGVLQKALQETGVKINRDSSLAPAAKQQQIKRAMAMASDQFVKIRSQMAQTQDVLNGEGLDKVLNDFSLEISTLGSDPASQKVFLNSCRSAFQRVDGRVNLQNVPEYFAKDDVLAALRTKLAGAQAEMGEDSSMTPEGMDQLLAALEQVQRDRGPISQEVLSRILDQNLDGTTKQWILHKLTPMMSSAEILVRNNNSTAVRQHLKKLSSTGAEATEYAFKTGLDNERELLGVQKLLPSLGLESFMLSKTPQRFEGARLGKSVDPEGIASRWVPGKEFPVSLRKDWADVDFRMEKAKQEGNVTEELKTEWTAKRQAMLDVGGTRSLAQHLATDILFGAGDSHWGQYKGTPEGEFGNFDWARFLAPHPAYQKAGMTFLTLRIETLDHPIATEPMTGEGARPELSELVKKIQSWDGKAITRQWADEGLVGTSEFFLACAEKMRRYEALHADLRAQRITPEQLDSLCREFGVEPQEGISPLENARALQGKLEEAYRAAKKEVYQKVHPQAIDQFQTRLTRMQDYLKTADSPTLQGAFDACYQEVSLFTKVLKRMEPSVGGAMVLQNLSKGELAEQKESTAKLRPRKARAASLSPGLQAKLSRAAGTARQRFQGVRQGKKPMDAPYTGELIDRKHRYGTEIYEFWKTWEGSDARVGFQEWMGQLDLGRDVPGKDQLQAKGLIGSDGRPVTMNTVTYMDAAQRDGCELAKNDEGFFVTPDEGLLNTDPARPHIFVMNEGKLWIAPYEKGKINHSSFFRGAPVESAGRMVFKNGELVSIVNHSGHYKPGRTEMLRVLTHLRNMAMPLKRMSFELMGSGQTYANALEAYRSLEEWDSKEATRKTRGYRPLEGIVVQAMKTPGAASEGEIRAMKDALATLREEAPPAWQARTAYNGLG